VSRAAQAVQTEAGADAAVSLVRQSREEGSEPAPRCSAEAVDLAVVGLQKSFDGTTVVLSEVTFAIAPRQAVALIGANGSGKSTLLRCCLGLIEPDRGSIRLFDKEVTDLGRRSLRQLRARVGFVFQRHHLVPRLSVLSNVVHGALARSCGPRTWFQSLARHRERAQAWRCLELVGLAHLAERRADQLSGGESQRVAIARALMQEPSLVLADEPVASLDPKAGEEVMCLFVDLMRRQGVTLFFTTHRLEHALQYADRVLALRGGRLVLDAPTVTLDHERVRGLYA
jgi:phosphonate transport system ATP-binding protein